MHSILHAFEHSVVWTSVIASAFVALVTTLLVEYLAKPWLEARKERIVDKGRDRRSALTNFRRALNLANRLAAYRGHPPEVISLMDEQIRRNATYVEEYALSAYEFIRVPKSVSREWEYVSSSMNAFAAFLPAGLQYLSDENWEKLEGAFNQMTDFYKLAHNIEMASIAQTQTDQKNRSISCA